MPSRNPRVNVTLTMQQYDLVSRLAKSQGRSRSAVLLELLETVTPVLQRVVVITEAAQRVQAQAKEGFRESAERAEAAILPQVTEAMGQFDLLVEDRPQFRRFSAGLGRHGLCARYQWRTPP